MGNTAKTSKGILKELSAYIADLYVSRRWFAILISCAVLAFVSYFFTPLFYLVQIIVQLLLLFTIIDYALLFFIPGGITATRTTSPRFSIGDENEVSIAITNTYPYRVRGRYTDELPFQFQERNFVKQLNLPFKSLRTDTYSLRPLSRGVYSFGHVIFYASTPLGLLQRRFRAAAPVDIKVYPSYQMLRKYQLMAMSDSPLTNTRKIRRLGHSLEFEKIKDYVPGDDVRTINWKATARSNKLMVNAFTDARQQQVYCLIDKGRNMKMPFEGMTLLDYSINASLAILNVAITRQDKGGLITYANKIGDIIAADRRNDQMHRIMETLYLQQTDFLETDYQAVLTTVQRSVTQRSLMLIFTNFETYSSLERQLPFLKKIAHRHLTCVVFFQNTLLKEIHENEPDSIEGIYVKTIADQFDLEKRLIVKELRTHGILSVLTTPKSLTIDVINKYLELKARQMV